MKQFAQYGAIDKAEEPNLNPDLTLKSIVDTTFLFFSQLCCTQYLELSKEGAVSVSPDGRVMWPD